MLKNILKLTILINIILVQSAFSQTKDINSILDSIELNFYQREVINTHINKDIFIPNENIWINVVNTFDGRINNNPTILYSELYDLEQKRIVVSKKSKLINGKCSLTIQIPSNTNSGTYVLRNFTQLQIDNSYKPSENLIQVINNNSSGLTGIYDFNYSDVEIAVEGGNDIPNHEQKYAFFFNPNLLAEDSLIKLYDDSNILVSELKLNKHGIAYTNLKRETNKGFHIIHNGKKYLLPQSNPEGISISIKSLEDGINVTLLTNDSFKQKNNLTIINLANRTISYAAKIDLKDNYKNILSINKENLEVGINTIALINNEGKIVSNRSFYLPKSDEINITSSIETNNTYQKRMNVIVLLKSKNIELKDASVSIQEKDISIFKYNNWFINQLTNNLKSNIPLDDLRLAFEENRKEDINNALLFYQIPVDDKPFDKMLIQSDNFLKVSGEIKFQDYKFNEKDSIMLKIYIPKERLIYEELVSSNLSFNIPIFDLIYNEHIYIETRNNKYKKIKSTIEFNKPSYQLREFKKYSISSNMRDLFTKYWNETSLKSEIDSTYSKYDLLKSSDGKVKEDLVYNNALYSKADYKLDLDEYMELPTVKDVFVEIVPTVNFRRRKKQLIIQLFNEEEKRIFKESPLVILDGYPVSNINWLLSIPAKEIKSIETLSSINQRVAYGSLGANGVIIIESLNKDLKKTIFPDLYYFEGFAPESTFINYEHSEETTSIPDLRTQLYWNPNLVFTKRNAQFNFYTSDLSGNYILQIKGIDANGDIVEYSVEFVVE